MRKCYIELRRSAAKGTDSVIADCMRHLHTRQHLGRAVVVCDQPLAMLGVARKQWLRLSRVLQKQRASTLNADKILKYTHTITHMQHMQFSSKTPIEQPDADVCFLTPGELAILPVHCWSVYIMTSITPAKAKILLNQLPSDTLIIDYNQSVNWRALDLQPKSALEARVSEEWRQVKRFMQSHGIDLPELAAAGVRNVEAMDDALDTLLGINYKFLQIANEFQRALELARPLRLTKQVREDYDSLILLAHRVQALSSGAFTQHFLETYNEDDTFFLYDRNKKRFITSGESLADAIARHMANGRAHLALALRLLET